MAPSPVIPTYLTLSDREQENMLARSITEFGGIHKQRFVKQMNHENDSLERANKPPRWPAKGDERVPLRRRIDKWKERTDIYEEILVRNGLIDTSEPPPPKEKAPAAKKKAPAAKKKASAAKEQASAKKAPPKNELPKKKSPPKETSPPFKHVLEGTDVFMGAVAPSPITKPSVDPETPRSYRRPPRSSVARRRSSTTVSSARRQLYSNSSVGGGSTAGVRSSPSTKLRGMSRNSPGLERALHHRDSSVKAYKSARTAIATQQRESAARDFEQFKLAAQLKVDAAAAAEKAKADAAEEALNVKLRAADEVSDALQQFSQRDGEILEGELIRNDELLADEVELSESLMLLDELSHGSGGELFGEDDWNGGSPSANMGDAGGNDLHGVFDHGEEAGSGDDMDAIPDDGESIAGSGERGEPPHDDSVLRDVNRLGDADDDATAYYDAEW